MKSFIISLIILIATISLAITGSISLREKSDILYSMADGITLDDTDRINAISSYWDQNKTFLYTVLDSRMLDPIEESIKDMERASEEGDISVFSHAVNSIMQSARALQVFSSFLLENIL